MAKSGLYKNSRGFDTPQQSYGESRNGHFADAASRARQDDSLPDSDSWATSLPQNTKLKKWGITIGSTRGS